MLSVDRILRTLDQVFEHGPEPQVAHSLLLFLSSHSDTRHITIQLMRQLISADRDKLDTAIVRTLQYLSGDAIGLLDLKFEFLDADEIPHAVSDEEAKAVLERDIDPLTGYPDRTAKARLVPYFEPRIDLLRQIEWPKK